MTFYTYSWGHPFPIDRRLVYFFSEKSSSHIQDIPEITFIIIFLCFVIIKLEQQRAFCQIINLAKLVIFSIVTEMLMDNTGYILENFAFLPHSFLTFSSLLTHSSFTCT